MIKFNSFSIAMCSALMCGVLVVGCAGKKDAAQDAPAVSAASDNPYAAFAGDWLTEAYAMTGGEPLVVTLVKGTNSSSGWSMKFTHMDAAVPATKVFMKGDSLVMTVGPYPSALRDGATVQSLTSYLHAHGDEMSGRFHAVYEGGDMLAGRLSGEKVK